MTKNTFLVHDAYLKNAFLCVENQLDMYALAICELKINQLEPTDDRFLGKK